MFKFLHAADIHLDSPLRGLQRYEGAPVDEIRQASRRALENLVQLAIDQSVAFVLIAGDLYDGDWKDHRTGLYFVSQMVRLREAGIPVIAIAGNHDAANKMTRTLPLPENVHMLDHKRPETFCLDQWGVAIHGQSFATGAVLEDLSAAYPPAVGGMLNIGLLHTCATGREGHQPYAPCTIPGLISKHYDYWALGHAHGHEVLNREPDIIFSGNVQGRHIHEHGPKGCMLVRRRCPAAVAAGTSAAGRVPLAVVLGRCHRRGDQGRPVGPLPPAARKTHGRQRRPIAGRAGRDQRSLRGPSGNRRPAGAVDQRHPLDGPGSERRPRVGREGPHGHHAAGESRRGHRSPTVRVGELARLIEELRGDPEAVLRLLADDLGELRKKLPPELTEGPEAIDLGKPDTTGELLDQVRQMLVGQMVSREGPK